MGPCTLPQEFNGQLESWLWFLHPNDCFLIDNKMESHFFWYLPPWLASVCVCVCVWLRVFVCVCTNLYYHFVQEKKSFKMYSNETNQ